MNDSICLCKAKRLDNREWISGYIVRCGPENNKQFCMVPYDAEDLHTIPIIPETICRYFGVSDKNCTPIYENDLVKDDSGDVLTVKWNHKFASYSLIKENWLYSHFFGEATDAEDLQVIGNIFDK